MSGFGALILPACWKIFFSKSMPACYSECVCLCVRFVDSGDLSYHDASPLVGAVRCRRVHSGAHSRAHQIC